MYKILELSGDWDESLDAYIQECTVTNGKKAYPMTIVIEAANLPGQATLYASEEKKEKICSFPKDDLGRFSQNTRTLLDALDALPEDADPAAADSPIRNLDFIKNLYD